MTRKHAIINNNEIIEVLSLSQQEVEDRCKVSQMLIDIEDMIPTPSKGWLLQGNKLVQHDGQLTLEQQVAQKIRAARAKGDSIKNDVTDKLGARNVLTGKTEAYIITMASQLNPIGQLLSGGALRTAQNALISAKPAFPEHADIFDYAINLLSEYLGN